jgi:SAM-dependent methyltransferase
MIIVHKLSKLATPVTYERAWRRAQRYLFPLPLRPIVAGIDQARLREIQARYRNVPRGFAKYTDVDHDLRLNRERVQDLQLHRTTGQCVFDLGCGGGFFLYILKRLGHDVLGLDTDEHPLYTELTVLFGVPRIVWRIKPFEPLPDAGRRFDWITAFSIAFDIVSPGETRWAPANGISCWKICVTAISLLQARCTLRSIPAYPAPFTRRSCAIFFLLVAQEWSVNGFSLQMGCDSAR